MSPMPSAGRWLWDNPSQTGRVCFNSKDKVVFPVPIVNIAHTNPVFCWITVNKSPEINHSKEIPRSHSALFLHLIICCTIHGAALCTGLLIQPCLITRFAGSWRQEKFLNVVDLIFFPIFRFWLIKYAWHQCCVFWKTNICSGGKIAYLYLILDLTPVSTLPLV